MLQNKDKDIHEISELRNSSTQVGSSTGYSEDICTESREG